MYKRIWIINLTILSTILIAMNLLYIYYVVKNFLDGARLYDITVLCYQTELSVHKNDKKILFRFVKINNKNKFKKKLFQKKRIF